MIQVNILEQLTRLFEIFSTNSYVLILSISSVVFFLILLVANKFKNKKITKILCIFVYLIVFGTLIFFYHKEILNLLDYLMNNIFLFLFFPNLAVYALVLVIINFIIVKSTFSNNENKFVKIINIICFILFNIIFYLIIDNVIKNKVDVYEQLSIYTNNDLLILIELSMNLFLLWLVILLIFKISTNLVNYTIKRKELVKVKVANEVIEKELENVPLVSKTNFSDVVEIQAPKVYNFFNDYIDIEPIKKNSNKFVDHEIEIPELEEIKETYNIIEEIKEEKNLDIVFNQEKIKLEEKEILLDTKNNLELTNEEYKEEVNPMLTFEITDANNSIELENNIIEKVKEEYNPLTTFEIVDTYSTNDSLEIEKEYTNKDLYNDYYKEDSLENNMNLLFGNSNNYLSSIVDDINKLRNNQDDKNQIKKVYESIKLSQKDLTLNDYNNLIRMLIEIKK